MALFESYERRIDQINAVLNSYGIASIEEAEKITKDAGLDVYAQIKGIQPICFENACWAYTVGAAIAIKKGCRKAADAAAAIGEGLQSFCIPGSVADTRKVGLGHGNLGKMLLEEETECFCFLAGHESFAAAEGAIGIAEKANKVRQKPLRVILNSALFSVVLSPPMYTSNFPGSLPYVISIRQKRSIGSMISNDTSRLSPGFSVIFSKPFNSRTGRTTLPLTSRM